MVTDAALLRSSVRGWLFNRVASRIMVGSQFSDYTEEEEEEVYVHVHGDRVKDKWGVDNEGTRVRERSKCPQPPVT